MAQSKCPRCDRPFDNAFPEGIRVQVGWIISYLCYSCVSYFLSVPHSQEKR